MEKLLLQLPDQEGKPPSSPAASRLAAWQQREVCSRKRISDTLHPGKERGRALRILHSPEHPVEFAPSLAPHHPSSQPRPLSSANGPTVDTAFQVVQSPAAHERGSQASLAPVYTQKQRSCHLSGAVYVLLSRPHTSASSSLTPEGSRQAEASSYS